MASKTGSRVAARTAFLNEGTDAFLSSPSCAGGKECQIVIFGAGFDTRSIRYQREGLRFFEVDLPDTIEATIVEADAVVKGQTASSSYKPAILDNGVRGMVPPHISSGTRIVVDVYEQTYVRRAD